MNNYYDKYGRLHDKPCIDGEPSSNNGWIYTAYAKKLGIPLDENKLWECKQACQVWVNNPHYMYLTRSPGKKLPPMSRDEILGMAALGLLHPNLANTKNWNFSPFPLPRLNPFKLISQLLECRGKHRNYFWQNKLDQVYHVAFSVPVTDRAFILRCWGETSSLRYGFYRAIEWIDSLSSKENGIRWLKYGKSLKGMQKEFPADHPLRQK